MEIRELPEVKRGRGRPRGSDEDREQQRRLNRVDMEEARKLIDDQIKNRFIEEVEILEKEGRVPSRAKLERDLLMYYNKITQMKYGKAGLQPSAIFLLKKHYNADHQYILTGFRDPEHSGSIRAGIRLNIYKPYIYEYKTWKVKKKDEEESEEG